MGKRSMKRFKIFALTALGVAAAVDLSACGDTSTTTPSPQSGAQYNAAIGAVVNPSSHKGGTIRFNNSSVPDSTDPGNTYHASISRECRTTCTSTTLASPLAAGRP